MTNEEKLDALAEILDASDLRPEMSLDELNWDSMAMLGVIALAKRNGKSVAGSVIREMQTVEDIMAVL